MQDRPTYPKHEKLKSRTTIDRMFTVGQSVSKYPLRLVYITLDESAPGPIQMGVSVSKKYFRKAVDRNYYKRVLREAYRHHKHILTNVSGGPYAFMLLYQTKERLDFGEIIAKTEQLFEKFARQQPEGTPE